MAINVYRHCTPAGAGLKNGTTWANAFDEPALEVFLEGAVVAGDVIFIMDGAYTLDSDINCSARDGTKVSPIIIIGVRAGTVNEGAAVVYADWSRAAADRPFFDGATFEIRTGDYYIVRNVQFQSSDTYTLVMGNACIVENCDCDNDAAAANKFALAELGLGIIVNNDISSANCNGLYIGANTQVYFNYIHDCPNAGRGIGVSNNGAFTKFAFNIFDNLTVGINAAADRCVGVLNNTFYNVDTGIVETTADMWACINNLMEGNTTAGFSWAVQTDINFFWRNHGNDARCTDMWANVDIATVFQDYEVTAGDPLLTTPGVDHSLQDGSPCEGIGMSIIKGVG